MNDPLTLVPAWRLNDAKINKDATEFWSKLGALPHGVTHEQRLSELCVAAYAGDELVGVATMQLSEAPRLRCRLGFFRCLVSPAFIQRRLAVRLIKQSHDILEKWSKENPQEKILGMAAILESPDFDNLGKRLVWPGEDFDLWLVGYTPEGQQLRLTWFKHARLD